jgi:hypothetical protein
LGMEVSLSRLVDLQARLGARYTGRAAYVGSC